MRVCLFLGGTCNGESRAVESLTGTDPVVIATREPDDPLAWPETASYPDPTDTLGYRCETYWPRWLTDGDGNRRAVYILDGVNDELASQLLLQLIVARYVAADPDPGLSGYPPPPPIQDLKFPT